MSKLFMGGYPLETTELELVQLVAPYADVKTIQLVFDKISKKNKGFCFVEVATHEQAAEAALALDGMQLGDRELRVNIAPDQPKRQATAYRKIERPQPGDYAKRPRRPRV